MTLGATALTIANGTLNPGASTPTSVSVPNNASLQRVVLIYQGFTTANTSTFVLDTTDGIEIQVGR